MEVDEEQKLFPAAPKMLSWKTAFNFTLSGLEKLVPEERRP